MRADRLVAILLLLQTRGQVTASEVADELEVSERTARRDLDALGIAGLPIYSVQGRNGGWRLAGGGKTDLSGLTGPEARALFLVAGPSSSATPEVKAALRKLVRALPEGFREDAQAASGAIVVDPGGWDRPSGGGPPTPPLLDPIQHAVIEGQQLTLGYVARDRAETSRVVHPLGLASKGENWYLVADTEAGMRTFRVDRTTSVEPTGDRVVRPEGFDLADAWRLITGEVDRLRTPVEAWARVDADHVPWARMAFGTRLQIGPAEPGERVPIEVRGHSVESLAAELAAFGGSLEVTEPAALRARLGDLGRALAATYADDAAAPERDPG
ncbi:YafY family transcriptional regulator [Aquihabitans sp. G128]|uniref:helix-turn-helix transcriptional regulator n=1 Tax=Aquihabitans sp. G128 TaxID=2849779 RepID=UPI001C24DE76|nr:YafY family protein [Aquihabitans sp. G128]QXC61659.1 YafY family transcriptional regulator [Aquihabitans sp. G128]